MGRRARRAVLVEFCWVGRFERAAKLADVHSVAGVPEPRGRSSCRGRRGRLLRRRGILLPLLLLLVVAEDELRAGVDELASQVSGPGLHLIESPGYVGHWRHPLRSQRGGLDKPCSARSLARRPAAFTRRPWSRKFLSSCQDLQPPFSIPRQSGACSPWAGTKTATRACEASRSCAGGRERCGQALLVQREGEEWAGRACPRIATQHASRESSQSR